MLKKLINQLKRIRSKARFLALVRNLQSFVTALFDSVKIKSTYLNVLIAIPRIATGILLIFDAGRAKIGMPVNETSGYISELMETSFRPSWMDEKMTFWIDFLEKMGQGSVLILGFNTRIAAFAMLWSTAERWLNGLFTKSLATPLYILFIAVCLYSLILGSGKIGIDYWISRRIQSKKEK